MILIQYITKYLSTQHTHRAWFLTQTEVKLCLLKFILVSNFEVYLQKLVALDWGNFTNLIFFCLLKKSEVSIKLSNRNICVHLSLWLYVILTWFLCQILNGLRRKPDKVRFKLLRLQFRTAGLIFVHPQWEKCAVIFLIF